MLHLLYYTGSTPYQATLPHPYHLYYPHPYHSYYPHPHSHLTLITHIPTLLSPLLPTSSLPLSPLLPTSPTPLSRPLFTHPHTPNTSHPFTQKCSIVNSSSRLPNKLFCWLNKNVKYFLFIFELSNIRIIYLYIHVTRWSMVFLI